MKRVLRFVVVAYCFTISAALAQSSAVISREAQISRENVTHAEPLIGTDPRSADRLIACAYVGGSEGDEHGSTIAYSSTDGGLTWRKAFEVESKLWSSDPSCLFDNSGSALLSSDLFNGTNGRFDGRITIFRSNPAMDSWTHLWTFPYGDRSWVALNPLQSTPQTIYLSYLSQVASLDADAGNKFAVTAYASSDVNGGFTPIMQYLPAGPKRADFSGHPTVLRNGRLFVPVLEYNAAVSFDPRPARRTRLEASRGSSSRRSVSSRQSR